jgi:hypothetical protein
MDPKMYPTGRYALDPAYAVTTITLTDKLPLIRGDSGQKYMTLTNFLGNMAGMVFASGTYTTSGAISSTDNFAVINNATPTTAIALTIAAPAAGRLLAITQQDAGSAGNTVTLTAGTFDGTHNRATFDAKDETLVLFGVSATRFVVVENVGSIVLATS